MYLIRLMIVAAAAFVGGSAAWAQSHSYINLMRSSTTTHVFVSQSVEGEFGDFTMSRKDGKEDVKWKGYGIGTDFGLELMKFIQFQLGHTFVNMQRATGALESLRGSRLNLGTRLVFLAPIFNLELGGGLLGSRLDYQKQLDNGSLYGSGMYYSIGMNHYFNSRVSVFTQAKMAEEHLVKNNGSTDVETMRYSTTSLGLGFRIWL